MPSKSPKKAPLHDMDEIGDLIGKRVLVPARIFPNEAVPKGKGGWEAEVRGANKDHRNALDIVFPGHWEQYFFPASEVRTWEVLGDAKKAASPKKAPSPKKAASPQEAPSPKKKAPSELDDKSDEEETSSDDDDFEVDAEEESKGPSGDAGTDDGEATETEDLPARTPAAAVVEEDKDDAAVSPPAQPSTGKRRIVSAKAARVTVAAAAAAAAAKGKAPEPAPAAAVESEDEDEEIEVAAPATAAAGPSSAPTAAKKAAVGAKAKGQAGKRSRGAEEVEEEEWRAAQRARGDGGDAPWYVTAAREVAMAAAGVALAYVAMSKADL